ncbi:MAG TPA: ABC transporter substrate-binding protein [Actinomycetes bacterium]|nr:ABC transporter substrate-binding protein [Actinomycetes bacterium]
MERLVEQMRDAKTRAPNRWAAAVLFLVLALTAAACGSDDNGGGGDAQTGAPAKIRMQLSWIPDAQFAGYILAKEKGFYKDENLEVELLPGGPNVNAVQQVVTGAAEMTVNKVSELYAARDKGLPVVSIAQFDQRSSFPLVARNKDGIDGPADLKGKKIGIWYGGDEYEFFALMKKFGIDPEKDIDLFEQGFTMDPWLKGDYPVAMVTSFNELNVIRLSGLSDDELTIINPSDYGISVPHGALLANQKWLEGNKDAAARFVRATMKGWDYTFEHADEAAGVTAKSALAAGGEAATKDLEELQRMSIAEMQRLHYPEGFDKAEHAKIDPAIYSEVAGIVKEFGLVKNDPDVTAAYDVSIWQTATGGQ